MSAKPGAYLGQVMSLFGLHKEAEPQSAKLRTSSRARRSAAQAEAGTAKGGAQEEQNRQAFEARLKDITAHPGVAGGITAGRVHMLNLEKVRERLGDRWTRFADRIHEVIKSELKTRLGPRDLFTRSDESTYVIVFGDCSEVEARLRVAILSEQILEKLLGEAEAKDLSALGVQRVVAQADGDLVTEAVDRTQTIMDALSLAEAEGAASYNFDDVIAGRRALSPEEINDLLGGMESDLRAIEEDRSHSQPPAVKIERLQHVLKELKEIEQTIAVAEPAGRPAAPERKREPCLAWVEQATPIRELIREIKTRTERQIVVLDAERLRASTEPSDDASEVGGSLNLDFDYLPMWHGPSQKIGIYRCQTYVRTSSGATMKPPSDDQDQEADFWAIVDRLTLRRVREDLRKALSRKLFNGIVVPVHFTTIHRHGNRAAFLELCTNIPQDFRKFLIWEVRACPLDSWSIDLPRALKAIAPFGRAVFLTLDDVPAALPRIRRALPALRTAGVQMVGVDAAALGNSEADVLDLLETVAQLAGSQGLKCYGEGFHSLSLTICAVCMGYQHLAGEAIARPTAEPLGIHATEMAKIYSRALAQDVV